MFFNQSLLLLMLLLLLLGKPIPGSKAALVYGQMNEPPGALWKYASLSGVLHLNCVHLSVYSNDCMNGSMRH